MTFKSIIKKILGIKSKECKCKCDCSPKIECEETHSDTNHIKSHTYQKFIVPIGKVYIEKETQVISETKKCEEPTTIEKISESIQKTEPTFQVVVKTEIVEIPKVTAKEIKEKVKKPIVKTEEKVEIIKPKPRKKPTPKKDKPTE